MNLESGGILVVGVAALWNIDESGAVNPDESNIVHSQAAYLVFFADPEGGLRS